MSMVDKEFMEPTRSLERIYPKELDRESKADMDTLRFHLERYRFATRHLAGTRILDIASGCGYGTQVLANSMAEGHFTGVDSDGHAIAYAEEHYASTNTRFIRADAMRFQAEKPFHTIVTLETIEHLPDPEAFIAQMTRILAPEGRIIASVPTTPTKDGNRHHLHDFTESSIQTMFGRHGFEQGPVFKQIQPFYSLGALFGRGKGRSSRAQNIPRNLWNFYKKNPAAIGARLGALCRFGFNNHFLTAVYQRG